MTEPRRSARMLHLDIAGRGLVADVRDPVAADAVEPALGHLAALAPADATRFRIWSDDEHPHPLWCADALGSTRLSTGGLAVARAAPPQLEVFEPSIGIELWGTREAFAGGDTRAYPASTAIAAWLATSGALVLHVGAVAFDGRAVVLVGAGGAGKSTATLACALSGGALVGDDLCVVETGSASATPTVHALFATARVNADTDARLGLEHWPTLGTSSKGKRVLAIEPPMRLCASAPISAIVALRPAGTAPDAPAPITASAAVRALTATAAQVALGAGGLDEWFAMALHLARTVPAFELATSWDIPRLVTALASTIDGRR